MKPCLHAKKVEGCALCGDGHERNPWCKRTQSHGCDCPPKPALQLLCTANGIGDHLMGCCAAHGLQLAFPDHDIVYVAKQHEDWVKEFGGYDHLISRPVHAPLLNPFSTYDKQMAEHTRGCRSDYYSSVTGQPCVRPPFPAGSRKEYVLLCPWSCWGARVYPPAQWLVLERLLMLKGLPTYVLDEHGERNKNFKSRVVAGAGAKIVVDVVKEASLVICNDSGMAHVAGMVGTPAIALCHAIRGEKIFNLYPSVKVLNGVLSCLDNHWGKNSHPTADCTGDPCLGLASIRPERIVEAALRLYRPAPLIYWDVVNPIRAALPKPPKKGCGCHK